MTHTQRTIFISYRRTDCPDFAERIRDWMIRRYGRDHVLMDFDNIPPFITFEDYIREQIEQSDAILALIGPDWLANLHSKLVKGDMDFVRTELETALKLGKVIAPIRIENAPMPPAGALPDSLKPIAEITAAPMYSDGEFDEQIEWITRTLETLLSKRDMAQNKRPEARTLDQTLEWRRGQHPLLTDTDPVLITLMEDGDFQGAADDANTKLKKMSPSDPFYLSTQFYRAQALELTGNYTAAVKSYRAFLDKFRTDDSSEDRRFAVERMRLLNMVMQNRQPNT